MKESKIQWTKHTFNPWHGCTKISAGCTNCYAATSSGRNPGVLGVWGPKGTRVVKSESGWREPIAWNAGAAINGERDRVFCASIADVFEDWARPMVDASGRILRHNPADAPHPWQHNGPGDPVIMADVRARLFKLVGRTPHLDWLLLTKRAGMMVYYAAFYSGIATAATATVRPIGNEVFRPGYFLPNVWWGVSVEDQDNMGRAVELLKVPAAVRFLSVEPQLGPVEFVERFKDGSYRNLLTGQFHGLKATFNDGSTGTVETIDPKLPKIDWVIVGGESGPGARPYSIEWARSIIAQCRAAGCPVFVKQLGKEAYSNPTREDTPFRVRLRTLDTKGGDSDEWPDDLRVREFPIPRTEVQS